MGKSFSQNKPVPQEQVSRNIGEILREMRAPVREKRGEGERARACMRVCTRIGEKELCVPRAPIESCQKPFVIRLVWWQLPPVRESISLKFFPALMATVINPRCQEAAEAHIKGS